jgi:predicted ATP-grasp superfamily ATP-dependent carboligase
LTQQSVLIAALTGRALAQSARRAGFAPLVVDAFGDEDMRASAAAFTQLAEVTRVGFRARPLLAALAAVAEKAPSPPVGLVLGSGFEDTPKLVATLARHYQLIGNGSEAIARAKHPASFFALLDQHGVAHPETQLDPPRDPDGWLSKRIGGSGGAHVLPCPAAKSDRRRYYQRRMEGTPASLLAIAADGAMHLVGFSRQWTAGGAVRPYRYGGAIGPATLDAAIEGRMIAAAQGVCRALELVGLVSFDFLLTDGIPYLLEVNPRPGATIDVFDDANGALFQAHIAAWRGLPFALPVAAPGARAAGVLYAGPIPVVVASMTWPDWTADRPAPGTRIPSFRPIATVFADGADATQAERNCRSRLDELAHMLYARAGNTERTYAAEVRRPGAERLRQSGQAR